MIVDMGERASELLRLRAPCLFRCVAEEHIAVIGEKRGIRHGIGKALAPQILPVAADRFPPPGLCLGLPGASLRFPLPGLILPLRFASLSALT